MFSLLESALCLWIQVHPLWIQGLKRLVLWTQNLTLLEDQGLWIQTIVLYCSCAKAASRGMENVGAVAAARGRRRRLKGSGGNGEVLVAGARSGGGRRGGGTDACGNGGGDGGWTPSLAFHEQPLEMEETLFFSQMTARVCWGLPSPLIEPKMARRGKGPLEAHNPKPKILIENKGSQRERASRMGSRKGKNPPGSLKGRGK